MQESPILFSSDLYERHIKTIRNVYFTKREIDLIACLLNVRGSSKKIASFLSITHKTVQKHIENIMSKVGCNATDNIINFVEASGILVLLRQYYSLLQKEIIFEQSLKEIAKLNHDTKPFSYSIQDNGKDSISTHLKTHLDLVGGVSSTNARDCSIIIFARSNNYDDIVCQLQKIKSKAHKVFILLHNQINHKESFKKLKDCEIIDCAKQNYYFSFFNLINNLLPNLDIAKIQSNFKNQYEKISAEHQWLKSSEKAVDQPTIPPNPPHLLPNTKSAIFIQLLKLLGHCKSKHCFLSVLFVISVMGSGLLILLWNQMKQQEPIILRPDLVIPQEKEFLQRPEIINLIDANLHVKNTSCIPTVALVGLGGVGKTTLARYYARTHKFPLIWEINAETKESLISSFEELALGLASTKEQKRELSAIRSIQNPEQKEKELLNFTKSLLKTYHDWLLIYDNVESFVDIQKYFPDDQNIWGHGKVIITTRDSSKAKADLIELDELSEQEAFTLFCKILFSSEVGKLTQPQKDRIGEFLKYIPSFPLDISTAAYYIKNTSLTFEEYLERIEIRNINLTEKQPNFIKESSNYTQTRYGIVASSIRKLIEINPEYKELLLLMSLFDSQNIPLNFFEFHKNSALIDQFIYDLKKYSLITSQTNRINGIYRCFSLHRSTQTLSKKYLLTFLSQNAQQVLLTQYILTLKRFYQHHLKKDYKAILPLIPHLEVLIKNIDEIPSTQKSKDRNTQDVSHVLASIYSQCARSPINEKLYCEKVCDLQKSTHYFSNIEMANLLKNLAYTCMSMEAHDDAIKYATRSLELCAKIPRSQILMSDNYTIIADAYTHKNDFKLAFHTLEKALEVIKPIDPNLRKESEACILAFIGRLYSETYIAGERAEKGAIYMLDSLKLIDGADLLFKRKEKPKGKISCFISRHKVIYGVVLCRLGWYQDALDCFNDSKFIVDNDLDNCPHTFSNNVCQMRRGEIALRNGNLQEAEKLLSESTANLQRIVDKSNVFVFIPYVLSTEILIRLGKLDEAYQLCLSTLNVKKTSNTNYSNLMFFTLHYHAAIIQYKLGNFKKSLEHFYDFINALKPLCHSILHETKYDALEKLKSFDLPDQYVPLNTAIKLCLQSSMNIFEAIYGITHPFIRDYIAVHNDKTKSTL